MIVLVRQVFSKGLMEDPMGNFGNPSGVQQAKSVYRHVVLFQFKPGLLEETIRTVEVAFQALCKGLPFVLALEGGRNSSPEKLNDGFTHCFIVTFANAQGRDQYLPHPEHQAFCRKYLDPNIEKVCVLDYDPTVSHILT
jgi:Stress responsive A/B Barrel Domain